MSLIDIIVPDIGGHNNVNVSEVYVKIGDKVIKDDNLIMLETDKATVEVPADKDGIVKEILISVGDKINEGDTIVRIEASEINEQPSNSGADSATAIAPKELVSKTDVKQTAQLSVMPIIVPDLSGNSNVEIIEVNVKAGDVIKEEDSLITLETDKATMEIPSTFNGIIKELKVKLGDRVSQGDLILMVEVQNTTNNVTAPSSLDSKPVDLENTQSIDKSIPVINNSQTSSMAENIPAAKFDEVSFSKAFASPAIRKLARELGADLAQILGTGRKGRITEENVKTFVKEVMSRHSLADSKQSTTINGGGALDILPWPKVDFAKFGEVEVVEMKRIKKLSGANMARNWIMIPHVTIFEDADITDLEEFRKQLNEENKKTEIKITPLAFLIKAAVFALKQFTEFNASIDGKNIVYKNYYNIGFAADTPNGLVVPVIKNADSKGIVAIAKESSELAKLARDGRLKPSDMQGGTFTVSSLGGLGSTAFTPIINAPEVAILGVSKSSIKPIWNGKEFIPRLILPLSLSFDHRIIDGAMAARFSVYLALMLSDLRRMSL